MENQRQKHVWFKLKGLNRKTKTGIYATVEYGKEDWFHADVDESYMITERQYALFDMFKNSEENLWSGANHQVLVGFDGYYDSGAPKNPIIKRIRIDI
jgi:hypothetical protein